VAANIDEAERQMGRGYKGGFRLQERTNKREASGYKSVQTKERLQATRAYKQNTGYNGQVATRAYHKREATTKLQREATRAYKQKGCTTKTLEQ